jgi:hypothetical protein
MIFLRFDSAAYLRNSRLTSVEPVKLNASSGQGFDRECAPLPMVIKRPDVPSNRP